MRVKPLTGNRARLNRNAVTHARHEGDFGARLLAYHVADEHVERTFRFVLPADAVGASRQNFVEPAAIGGIDPVHHFRDPGIRLYSVVPQIVHRAVDADQPTVAVHAKAQLSQSRRI